MDPKHHQVFAVQLGLTAATGAANHLLQKEGQSVVLLQVLRQSLPAQSSEAYDKKKKARIIKMPQRLTHTSI